MLGEGEVEALRMSREAMVATREGGREGLSRESGRR